ncbi:reverse transcriptase [Gossypium australe]|uniref:Reverse transcriptase n=1 Tax=Gossypium australe TaxID=47621 RepID=A0A5B6VUH4_9ROSI|nr:reverse transcriptase [Gossypium australe]
MEKVRRSRGFLNGIDVEAEVILRSFSKNHINVMVKEENTTKEWRFTGFYGSPYVNNKNASWNLLKKLGQDQNHPWLVSRDFNEIMYSFEKSRGIPREKRRMKAFRETLEECQLEDLGYSGVLFTWERGNLPETNIKERLDKGVVNEKWRHLFPTGNIHHLTHSMSDHCPLLLNTKSGNIYVENPRFKIEAWWVIDESLEKDIKSSWESKPGTILEKLERLQSNLNEWA